jgi:hypothetical protein
MLSLYHKVTSRRRCTVKKELQILQCCAVNRGVLRSVYLNYDLGYIDLEEKTLQPLENPFGPKV